MARTTHVRAPERGDQSVLELLGRLGEAALTTLLVSRPDLADPPPRTLIDLANRAAGRASVEACRQELDLGCHQVHAALCLLPAPATLGQLAGLLAVDEDDPDLAAALGRLADRALILRDGDRLRLFPGLEILYPAGLGPPVSVVLAPQSGPALANLAHRLGVAAGNTKAATLASIAKALSEPERVSRLLAKAPAGAAELARHLAFDGPEGHTAGVAYQGDKTAAGWLANRGVVAPLGWDTVVLVREAGVALRGGKAFPNLSVRRPDLSIHQVDPAGVDRAAAERALRLVADVTTILDAWAADAPRQLKGGGLGIQVVRKAAKAVDRSEVEAARVIELAAAAGLVSIDAGSDAALPLPAYDRWSGLSVAGRWTHLVAAWRAWDLHLSLAGALDHKRKPIPPLLVRAAEPHAAARRGRVMATLVEAPPAGALPSEVVYARATWDAPALWGGGPASPATLGSWTLTECEMIGLCGLGALSTWGRLAAAGDLEGAEAALGRMVPAATSQFVVQADLTALAPAELVRTVLAELESMANLESRGAAALYRFTEASVRRSYEAGRTAPDILGFLEVHAAKGVPQALTYLVNDVGRRFGQLRVTAVACCLRSDDPSLLAEVVASRPAKRLGLRLLAPTVAAASADPPTVLDVLQAAGYLPAEEGPDGALVVSRPGPRRAVPDRHLAALAGRRPGLSAAFGPVGDPFSPLGRSTGGPPTNAAPIDDARSPAAIAARLVGANHHQKATKPPATAAIAPTRPATKGAAHPATKGAARPATKAAPGARPATEAAPRPEPTRSPTASLFDAGPATARPDVIARVPGAIADLLHQAWVADWPVRVAYTNKKGRMSQLTVSVLDVGDRDVLVQLISGWESRELALSRIGWARILTEAEEDALL